MDSFLQNFSAEGEYDSTGTFVIDMARARSKLGRYQLARFSDFPKFILSAAAVSDCTTLRIDTETDPKTRRSGTRVVFENWSLSKEELWTLPFRELSDAKMRPHRYLAVVTSALASKEEIQLLCRRQGRKFGLRIKGDKVAEIEETDASGRVEAFELRFSCNSNYEMFAVLNESSDWLPVPVFSNGKMLSRPFGTRGLRSEPIAGVWFRGKNSPLVELREPILTILKSSPTEASALILLVNGETPPFHLVVDGLAYELPERFRLPNVAGFLVAPDLARDLSYQNLVENARLEEIGGEIRSLAASTLKCLSQLKEPLDRNQGFRLWRLMDVLRTEYDMSATEAGLVRRMGGLLPVLGSDRLAALAQALKGAPPDQRDDLFEKYLHNAEQLWREDNSREAREYLKASVHLRKELGLPAGRDHTLLSLLQSEQKKYPDTGDASTWAPYLEGLGKWMATGLEEHLRATDCHPSWLLPASMTSQLEGKPVDWSIPYSDAEPKWLILWRHFEAARLEEAQKLLQSTPQFEFERHKRDWLETLWTVMNGRVSFLQSVKLRSTLSFLQLKRPSDTSLSMLPAELCSTLTARNGNWAQLMWLLWRIKVDLGPRTSRRLWWNLLIEHAIHLEFLAVGDTVAWKGPLELEMGL